MSEKTKELTWDAFRKLVFKSAMETVECSNCSTFKLFGYKHLDIRLVLYYHDCNQVFDFKKGNDKVEITQFYTADKTDEYRTAEVKQWVKENEEDKPEVK